MARKRKSPRTATDIDLPALDEPTVSIVVCNHNYARFLDSALESACDQDYPSEVVVVDDGSTDNSRAILRYWKDRARIVLQENAGQRAAYNAGFGASTGDVVIFLDSDDTLEPAAARCVARAFDVGVAKVHFRLGLISESGRRLGGQIPRLLASGPVAVDMTHQGILYPSAPGSGNAYRRTVLKRLFPLPIAEFDRHGADLFTVYGSGLFGEVRALEETLGSYRLHDTTGNGPVTTPLVFGNSAVRNDEVEQFRLRTRSLRDWISERTGGQIVLPRTLVDFSMEKVSFARAVFETDGYVAGVRLGSARMRALLRALWLRREYSNAQKLGLTIWAMVVLVAPRRLGFPLARYVCNPASRI